MPGVVSDRVTSTTWSFWCLTYPAGVGSSNGTAGIRQGPERHAAGRFSPPRPGNVRVRYALGVRSAMKPSLPEVSRQGYAPNTMIRFFTLLSLACLLSIPALGFESAPVTTKRTVATLITDSDSVEIAK